MSDYETRLRKYLWGSQAFEAPPVCTAKWEEKDWMRHAVGAPKNLHEEMLENLALEVIEENKELWVDQGSIYA